MRWKKSGYTWFIVDICPVDLVHPDDVSIKLSNYKLPLTHEALERRVGRAVSSLRWVTMDRPQKKGALITGLLTMADGVQFHAIHSWMGLSVPENPYIRSTYTVQIKPLDTMIDSEAETYLLGLVKRIAALEGEKRCNGSVLWTFAHRVEPYPKHKKIVIWYYRKKGQIRNFIHTKKYRFSLRWKKFKLRLRWKEFKR